MEKVSVDSIGNIDNKEKGNNKGIDWNDMESTK